MTKTENKSWRNTLNSLENIFFWCNDLNLLNFLYPIMSLCECTEMLLSLLLLFLNDYIVIEKTFCLFFPIPVKTSFLGYNLII